MKVKELYVEVDYTVKRRNNYWGRKLKGKYELKVKGLIIMDSSREVIGNYSKFEDEERYLFKREIEELSHKYRVKIVSSNIAAVEMIIQTYSEFPFYLKEDPFETFYREVDSLGWRRLQKIDPRLNKNKRKFTIAEKYNVVFQSKDYLHSIAQGPDKDYESLFKRVCNLLNFHKYIKKHLQRK